MSNNKLGRRKILSALLVIGIVGTMCIACNSNGKGTTADIESTLSSEQSNSNEKEKINNDTNTSSIKEENITKSLNQNLDKQNQETSNSKTKENIGTSNNSNKNKDNNLDGVNIEPTNNYLKAPTIDVKLVPVEGEGYFLEVNCKSKYDNSYMTGYELYRGKTQDGDSKLVNVFIYSNQNYGYGKIENPDEYYCYKVREFKIIDPKTQLKQYTEFSNVVGPINKDSYK